MLSGKTNRNINVRNVGCAHGTLRVFVGYTFLPKVALPNGMGFRFKDLSQSLKYWYFEKNNGCVAYWAMSVLRAKHSRDLEEISYAYVSTYSTNLLHMQIIWCLAQNLWQKLKIVR
jgi:hypothetical protein